MVKIGYYFFWRSATLAIFGDLNFNTGPNWCREVQTAILPMYSFYLISANFMRILATMVEYMLLRFFAIGQIVIKKKMWHFEILTLESATDNVQYLEDGSSESETDGHLGPAVPGSTYVGYFSCPIL